MGKTLGPASESEKEERKNKGWQRTEAKKAFSPLRAPFRCETGRQDGRPDLIPQKKADEPEPIRFLQNTAIRLEDELHPEPASKPWIEEVV
jgi:hypothetical protein